MASRKPRKGRPLRGGVGDAPAGRGGMADQIFQALEPVSADRIRSRTLAADRADYSNPTPENRAIETFQTVEDDLRGGMSQTKNDQVTKQSMQQLADSMIRVMDEANRPDLSPQDRMELAGAVEAYRGAFQSLPDDQKMALVSAADSLAGDLSLPSSQMLADAPRARGMEMAQFFGGAQDIGEKTPTSLIDDLKQRTGLRKARAQMMDARGDAAETRSATMLGSLPLNTTRPYASTEGGQTHRAILASLIDQFGLDPADVADATLADAAVKPFQPGEGVFLARDKFPAAERLSTYTGKKPAEEFLKANAINEGDIGRSSLYGKQGDVWNQYDAIVDRGGDPKLEPVVGGLMDEYDTIRTPTDPWTKQSVADEIAARQLTPEDRRVQEYLFTRAFGDPLTGYGMSLDEVPGGIRMAADPNEPQIAAPLALDWVAPWHRGQVERVGPDGSIVYDKFSPEEVTDTLLSQSGLLAESPHLRAAARERLLPQVQEAMAADGSGTGTGTRFNRNPIGRAMIDPEGEAYGRQKPKAVAPVDASRIDAIRQRLRKNPPGPGQNDLGFSEPMRLPAMARETAPNRLLAALMG